MSLLVYYEHMIIQCYEGDIIEIFILEFYIIFKIKN